ncbi:ParB/RepB/Spo0J family partition protein [Olsenella profusa]|uniref:ParB-like protein n=1 Tax=Olsenella profusa F0195 TaxID=1125712 RepID=U2TPK8_9ACTN|nr:ParB/RepB/Spo0J family partition protein [Olsenella profusa]ERL08058.1 ParB-like protein [Olsenella profusa F0195]
MIDSRRMTVRVADVVPNDGNPRRDAGDVAALARSIAATGGEPVQPIIVVPDGGRWRLVDGWRRWLAMRELGTEECSALCFGRMGDAEEAVCSMATDSKERLTDEEAARGFQTMLALGVSDERVAAVVGTPDVARVGRARRLLRQAPEQATMDGMLAAADDELDDEERASVMASAWPAAEARRIKERHKAQAALAAIRDVLDAAEYREGSRPVDPEREDLSYLGMVRSPEEAARFAEGHADVASVVAYEAGTGYALYEALPEGAGARAREARESELRRRIDEHCETYWSVWMDMRRYVLAHWSTPRGLPHLAELVRGRRDKADLSGCSEDEAADLMAPFDSEPSRWEVGSALAAAMAYGGVLGVHGDVMTYVTDRFTGPYDALVADGWEPGEDARAIREMCEKGDGDE